MYKPLFFEKKGEEIVNVLFLFAALYNIIGSNVTWSFFIRICSCHWNRADNLHVLDFFPYLNSAQLGKAEVDMLLAFCFLRKAFPETGGSVPAQDEQAASGFSTQLASPELSIWDKGTEDDRNRARTSERCVNL